MTMECVRFEEKQRRTCEICHPHVPGFKGHRCRFHPMMKANRSWQGERLYKHKNYFSNS